MKLRLFFSLMLSICITPAKALLVYYLEAGRANSTKNKNGWLTDSENSLSNLS